jgi:hypothetical protein
VLPVITLFSLGIQRVLVLLILCHFVRLVLATCFTESLAGFRNVNHYYRRSMNLFFQFRYICWGFWKAEEGKVTLPCSFAFTGAYTKFSLMVPFPWNSLPSSLQVWIPPTLWGLLLHKISLIIKPGPERVTLGSARATATGGSLFCGIQYLLQETMTTQWTYDIHKG